MKLPKHICETLEKYRSRFEKIENENQIAEILIRTAWDHREEGWGLSRKPTGNRLQNTPVGDIASDILHNNVNNLIWDVLIDAGVGGETKVNCGYSLGEMEDPKRPWVAPIDLDDPMPIDVKALKTEILNELRQEFIRYDSRIALRSEANDKLLCVDLTRGDEARANRDEAYAWETFKVERPK